jgi:serine/threonine protein kinase
MTTDSTRDPTLRSDQTLDMQSAASHGTAGGAADTDGSAPNGYWAGPVDDPDRYELLGDGISGGEGTTYKARYHGEAGEPLVVAIKHLHPPPGESPAWPKPDDWARWRDQLQIIHQVRNDHLVRVRTIFAGAPPHLRGAAQPASGDARFETPYVVMDWIPGRRLDRLIRASLDTISAGRRIAWIDHLAGAISALHSATRTAGNPLVHRDIKPGNCIVTPEDRLVLIDIGTMRRADIQPDPRGMYSEHYAAPEVLADLSAPREAASDLFSLGGVAYFCLTGADPPAAADITEKSIQSSLVMPSRWRRRIARHLVPLLSPNPAVRRQVRLDTWVRQLRLMTRPRRWPWILVLLIVVVSLALIPYGSGPAKPQPGQQVPGGQPQSLAAMKAFGESYQHFGFSVRGNTVTIDPPANYNHLWGGFLPAGNNYLWGGTLTAAHCATTVTFDMTPAQTPMLPNFGLAVAPRAQLVDDRPQGASVQYEYETDPVPGSYIRPVTLPNGAWVGSDKPVPAPDVRLRHHVRVYAEGRSMTIDVDGRQVAHYELPAVECGGVAIRAWGSAFTLSSFSVHGS